MTPLDCSPDSPRLTVDALYPQTRLRARVSIARPRPLDPIEWAVLAAVDALDDVQAAELAAELGLGDAAFAQATIDDLAALKAIEVTDGGLQLSARGRTQFAQKRVDTRPDERIVTLHVDPIHGIALDRAAPPLSDILPQLIDEPPAPEPDAPVDLALAEHAVRLTVPKLLENEAAVVACEVSGASMAWAPAKVTFAITGSTLSVVAVTPDPGPRTAWLAQVGPTSAVLDSLAHRHAWAGDVPRIEGAHGAEPTDLTLAVRDAQSRVVLDARWLAAPGMLKALKAAFEDGVKVVILGAARAASKLRGAAWWVEIPARPDVAALIIDDDAAHVVGERVCAAAWSGDAVPLRWIQSYGQAAAAPIRATLLGGLPMVADESPIFAAARVDLGLAPPKHLAAAILRTWPEALSRLSALTPFLAPLGAESMLRARTFAAALSAAHSAADWALTLDHARTAAERSACVARLTDLAPADLANLAPTIAPRLEDADRATLRARLRQIEQGLNFADAVRGLVALGVDENDRTWAEAQCAPPPGFEALRPWARARLPLRRVDPTQPAKAIISVGLRPYRRDRRAPHAWHARLPETRALLTDLKLSGTDGLLADAIRGLLKARGAPPLPLDPALLACWTAGPAQKAALLDLIDAALPALDALNDIEVWLEYLSDLGEAPRDLRREVASRHLAGLRDAAAERRATDARWWKVTQAAWAHAGLEDTWLAAIWPQGRKKKPTKKKKKGNR